MSGGSYNYMYSQFENEYENRMYDIELNDLIHDLTAVLRAVEWWQSGDTCEETYRKSVKIFKDKWFHGDRTERLKGYIDKAIEELRIDLLDMQ